MTGPLTSDIVRERLIEALRVDLIGPHNDHRFARELLRESPSRWYLTGFLVPLDAPEEQRFDEQMVEEIDAGGDAEGGDDGEPPDRNAARRSYLPSSIGLTLLVPTDAQALKVDVEWGDYQWEGEDVAGPTDGAAPDGGSDEPADVSRRRGYRRTPKDSTVSIPLGSAANPDGVLLPASDGLRVVVSVRPVVDNPRVPSGARSVSVFLVNRRRPDEDRRYRAFVFQPRLTVRCEQALVPRPDPRWAEGGNTLAEWDDRVADLHYRDVYEYAVGHGVSASATIDAGACRRVATEWMPSADVERVVPPSMGGVELRMEALAELADLDAARAALSPLVVAYEAWIGRQQARVAQLEPGRAATAADLMQEARAVSRRIADGIEAMSDPQVLEAFRLANQTMAAAARRRDAQARGCSPAEAAVPIWRPFQLAFFLLSLRGIENPTHRDRALVDLLFFPTGGGKTEAYLGISAFVLVLRRLRHPGRRSGGVSVLMRYTLRLLTLDQLGRAAALICALELVRLADPAKLGEWPFEIGLWVGSAATPNRMGGQGYTGPGAEYTAYRKVRQFQQNTSRPAPIPLETCPWCGTKFDRNSFRLAPNQNRPENLWVICANPRCEFTGDRHLPIVTVDEPIYRRLPAFLIATVDKFAALPWTGQVGALFGLVQRCDGKGYLGPMDAGIAGTHLGGPLPPPDLIIQDELHLISGPLGTIAGVFETAIEALCIRKIGDVRVLPKIIASTATVRRADAQIRALFGRERVQVFPPPGIDRADSFFARTVSASESPARRYLGIAAQGRSLKVVLLRAALALLSAGQTMYRQAGGRAKGAQNPADAYMTVVGYFNSLRELGGSRRIIEDEVRARLEQYHRRRRIEPDDDLFTDRTIQFEAVELTSRVPTNEVSDTKRRLALSHDQKEHVDVALATNMISVGLDIIRLGLMMVLGQPKASAEYIQATSRVGRAADRPGLVVTLLNVHKPRDRSHYERFASYHASFYRAVEATSVTPFSPRALDRALAGALVGLVRHSQEAMTPAQGAMEITRLRMSLDGLADEFAARAGRHRAMDPADATRLTDQVRNLAQRLLDAWVNVQQQHNSRQTRLQYQTRESPDAAALLRDFLDPALDQLSPEHRRFRAARSMRDVEVSVELRPRPLNDWEG